MPPFVPSLLVEFRKRLTEDVLGEINEMIIDYNTPDDPIWRGTFPQKQRKMYGSDLLAAERLLAGGLLGIH